MNDYKPLTRMRGGDENVNMVSDYIADNFLCDVR